MHIDTSSVACVALTSQAYAFRKKEYAGDFMETLHGFDTIQRAITQPGVVVILAKTRSCAVCSVAESRLVNTVPMLEAIPVYRVYIEDDERYRGEALVFSVPTIIVYHNGREQHRESRFINARNINRLIERYLENKRA